MRGFLLSLDAIVAVSLMLLVAVFLSGISFTYSSPEISYQRLYYTGKDVLNVISVVEVQNLQEYETIQYHISTGDILSSDMDKSLLDVIGSLWASGNITEAQNITQDVIGSFLNHTNLGYEILIDNDSIYNNGVPVGRYYSKFSNIISGFKIGEPVDGFVSRAFITKANKINSKFEYFGGFIGNGNITKILELPGFDNIEDVYMEFDSGSTFTLYINGNNSGNYEKNSVSNLTADKWTVDSSHYSNFVEGNNTIHINFTNTTDAFIGGGYIKVTYNTSEFNTKSNETEYWFPGVDGVINIFDSIYVPGTLYGMSITLHFSSASNLFLDIGNVTVFEGNQSPAIIPNSSLAATLNFNEMSQRTVPIRIGHFSLNATNQTGNITDAILTTSRVDAMNTVDIPNGSSNISRIDAAIYLDNLFVDTVLNFSGNKVGLVSYKSDVPASTGCNGWKEPVTNDPVPLHCQIDNYDAKPGNRCPCCAIRAAITYLNPPFSNSLRKRVIVLMSDGSAEKTTPDKCPADYTGDPAQDTINEACDAYQNHSIQVYTIGFGVDADNELLSNVAACGDGKNFSSENLTGLQEIYDQIAQEISNESLIFEYQKITSSTINSSIHTDSNIHFDFDPLIQPLEFGDLSLTFESPRLSNSTGNDLNTTDPNGTMNGTKLGWYFIPNSTTVLDSKITSYSSQFWTDRVYVKNESGNWTRAFWLADYSNNYLPLGDPYIIQYSPELIAPGNNSIRIGVATDPDNPIGGSPDSRVIYTLKISDITLEGFSGVFPKGKGSTVTVYYDFNGDNIVDGSAVVIIGDGTDIFDPKNDSVDDAFMRLLDNLNFIFDSNEGTYGNGSAGNPYDGINQTNPIDLEITSEINFDSSSISGVPTLWGPSELEIRIWI